MTLDNKTGIFDRLTSASSDVAVKLQIHEMAVENEVMQMRQLADGLPIPAGGSAELKPGSYHVMLIGLKKPLIAGETFPLTLTLLGAPLRADLRGTLRDFGSVHAWIIPDCRWSRRYAQ